MWESTVRTFDIGAPGYIAMAATPLARSAQISAAIFSASMMVGILVLPRGIAGMIEASTTRKPADAANAACVVDDGVGIVRAAHAAGAADVERAGHVVAHVLGERGVVVGERGEIDAAAGQLPEDEIGQRGNGVERAGDDRRLDRVRASELIELPDFGR